jgi:SAM-dependent methyltransferase
MDRWTSGTAYERYVGRWSRPVAAEFLSWLARPPGLRWVDVGCGTGALTGAILATSDPSAVIGVDPAEGFLERARTAVDDPRASFRAGDARQLPLPDDDADAVVSALALNFIPDAAAAVGEFSRVARPGGVIAAYVWDYAEGMAMMRHFWDAAVALDPAAAELDEGLRFPLCRPEALSALWTRAGLVGAKVRAIEVPTVFADFDDYWNPFLGGQGPAPGYVSSLPEEQRVALRERLRAQLPSTSDSTIPMTARAWAVRGSMPT